MPRSSPEPRPVPDGPGERVLRTGSAGPPISHDAVMTGHRRTAGVLLGTVVLLAGCSSVGRLVEDPGPLQKQDRTISAVSAVELATSGTLTLATGQTPSLRITAGKNVIDHLTSEVAGDRLTLRTDRTVHNLGEVRYELVLPAARAVELSGSGSVRVSSPSALQDVELSGSGDVRVDGLDTEELTARLPGSGRITVAGTATRQRISIDGSGEYSAGGLAGDVAEVTIGGSGEASLQVARTLDAVITGSGSVTYTGNPTVTSRVTGSGDVVRR